MMSTTCGRILSSTRWTTASTNAGSGGAGGVLAVDAAGFCDATCVFPAGWTGTWDGIVAGDDGFGFSVAESLDLNCRLAARSLHCCCEIERAVSSVLCANGSNAACVFAGA